jgi:TRAP-type C4-dicarboxylate transport system permease small subunit
MKKVEKTVSRIIRVCGILATLVLAGMMLLTVADVLLRGFFNTVVPGSFELTVVLMVCVTFLGMGWTTLKGEHLKVDIIAGKLPKRGRVVLDIINYLAAAALCLLIMRQGFAQAMLLRKMSIASPTLGIPQYPFVLVVVFGAFLMLLAVIILLWNVKKETFQGDRGEQR